MSLHNPKMRKDNCDKCGSSSLTLHKNSDVNYNWECEDCGATMEAEKEDWFK